MADRVNTHNYVDGVCTYKCGVSEGNKEKSCDWRDGPPRAVPVSAFQNLGDIGERMKEIRAEEERARAEPPEGI